MSMLAATSAGAREIEATHVDPRIEAGPEPERRVSVALAIEEPLEIRLAGETLALTMRTPGNDRELALGFLYAEGIVRSLDEVGRVAHCGRTGDAGRENTIDVIPGPGVAIDPEARRGVVRGTLTTSACGVCGRRSIDDLVARCAKVAGVEVSAASASRMVEVLRQTQPLFSRTGGSHGAALFRVDRDGEVHVVTFEDVGRHNAVDKVIGSRLFARALPLSGHALLVSGRTSFEIVQKAAVAGAGAVIGVGAASSLAVDLAAQVGLSLYGFARHGAIERYA